MYLAHSGIALGAKRLDARLPLSWTLTAAWAYDLTGIGHWAPAAIAVAALAYWLGQKRWDRTAGLTLALIVVSHDVIDLVVGLQLLPGTGYIGLNLDPDSPIEFGLELTLILAGWLLYRSTLDPGARRRPELVIPVAALIVATTADFLLSAPVPIANHSPSPTRIALLATGIAITWASLIWADRRTREA